MGQTGSASQPEAQTREQCLDSSNQIRYLAIATALSTFLPCGVVSLAQQVIWDEESSWRQSGWVLSRAKMHVV